MKKLLLLVFILFGSHFPLQGFQFSRIEEFPIEVEASFLYWKLSGDGLDYALTKESNETLTEDEDVSHLDYKAKVHKINPSYEPGFRLKAKGALCPPCFTELLFFSFAWTHYQTEKTGSAEIKTPSGSTTFTSISPTLQQTSSTTLSTTDTNAFVKITGSLDFNYNREDLLLSSPFPFYDGCFTVTPGLGLLVLSFDDHMKASQTTSAPLNRPGYVKIRNDFVGIGPEAELLFSFDLGSNFSFFANGALSLVWGSGSVKQTLAVTESGTLSDPNLTKSTISDGFHHSIPLLNYSIGVGYRNYLFDCVVADVSLSFESTTLYDARKYLIDRLALATTSETSISKGTHVQMQGVTLTFGVEF